MTIARIAAVPWKSSVVHVEDAGEGQPVVFLHSSGMSGDQWRRTADVVGRAGFRTVVPHLLGSGKSTPWPEGAPFLYAFDVEVLGDLLARLGEPAHLVGHSYGGLTALLGAIRDPSRVRSIAVYDPVAFGVLDRERDPDAFANLADLRFDGGTTPVEREAWLQSFVDWWGGEGSWAKLRDAARAEFLRVGWVAHEGARTLVGDRTPASAYASLAVPTLLMTGEHTPSAAGRVVARLGEIIPGARVERFEGAGHMGPLTHVAKLNELVVAHLTTARR
jgi:pimeloyl-ACP methyl ester carboxylesterase